MSPTPLPQYTAHGLDYPTAYTEAGSGESLLLVHGSLCDYRYWRWQIPALSEKLHVLAPSLRGYWPGAFLAENPAFTVAQHTDDLIEFIRSKNGPMHVLGHSRGARVALEIALAAPGSVRSLILADPGLRLADDMTFGSFQIDAVQKLVHGDTEAAMSLFVDAVNGAGTWRQMVSWFKEMITDNAYTLLSQINEINAPLFQPERLEQIECPVLLLTGSNSPRRYGRVLDSLEPHFADVQRSTIALAAHGMNLANPKAFNNRVLQFIVS